MPTYQYRNLRTGETIERVERMADDRATEIDGDPVEIIITGGLATPIVYDRFKPHVNRQVAPYDPTFSHCQYDNKGRPIITSPDDVKRSGAKLERATGGKASRVWDNGDDD
ncbi:MAG: hypothetical protein RIB60_06080 [Phycisphaerales bacterium]